MSPGAAACTLPAEVRALITQKDVAKLAGVSFITVSRVVNNQGNVSEATRARVLEAVKALKYHPNSIARALNDGRTNTFGLVTPLRISQNNESNAYLLGLLDGIERSLRLNRFDMLLAGETNEDDDFDLLRLFHQRKVDGIIFLGLQKVSDSALAEIREHSVPCVVVADRPEGGFMSWLDSDNEGAGRDAVRRLAEAGIGSVGFVLNDPAIRYNRNIQDRIEGARAEAAVLGLETRDEWTFRGVIGWEIGEEAVRGLLRMAKRPRAFICGNDVIAQGVKMAARSAGLRIPEDLAIVGYDCDVFGQTDTPRLTTYRQPLGEMGFLATELLLRRVADPDAEGQHQILPLSFVRGETLFCP